MAKTAAHLLKGNDVKFEGQFHLEIGQIAPCSAKEKNTVLATPEAHIVENHPEFTVIEMTCQCSAKTRIKCEYTDTQSTGQKTDQIKNTGENDNAN